MGLTQLEVDKTNAQDLADLNLRLIEAAGANTTDKMMLVKMLVSTMTPLSKVIEEIEENAIVEKIENPKLE